MTNTLSGGVTFIDRDFDERYSKDHPARGYRDLIAEQGLEHLRAGVCPLPKLRYPRLAALGRWLIRISYGSAGN